MCRSLERSPPGWIWFVRCPGLICLAVRWSGLATSPNFRPSFYFTSFEFIKVLRREFVSPAAGNASLVFISDAIPFLRSQHVYLPLEVEFRGKRFIRKGAWRPRYILPCVLYCMEGEFEQIITKIRLSIKYKNNSLRSKFHWPLLVFPTNCRIAFLP